MEHNKNQLVPINNSLANFERQIAIGEKLLDIILSDSEKNQIKQLLIDVVVNNYDIIKLISYNYPWSEELIEKFKFKLNWAGICGNDYVMWNEKLIDKYFEFIDWESLCANYVEWNEEFIDKYFEFINWESLSVNSNIEWNEKLLNKYSNYLNFNSVFFSEDDGSLQLTPILLKKFIDKIDFKELSIDYELLPKEFIKKNVDALDWKNLESYTIENLEIFQHKIDWDDLSRNKNLILTDELIERFKYRWSWDEIIKIERKNGIPTYIRVFETRYSDGIYTNVYYDAGNVIDEEFLNALINHSVWSHLSSDTNFANNYTLIQKFENQWNWAFLTRNGSIKWTYELIEKYKNKIDWEIFSLNPHLPWSIDLIEKYTDKWDWKLLGMNTSLPWNLDFYKKYQHKFQDDFLFFCKDCTFRLDEFWIPNRYLTEYHFEWHNNRDILREKFDSDLIFYVKNILDWDYFSRNYDWLPNELEKYKECMNPEKLSSNTNIAWSVDLLKMHEDRWDWERIAWNKSILDFDLNVLTKFINEMTAQGIISYRHPHRRIRSLFFKHVKLNDAIAFLEKYHKADTN